MGGTLPHVDRCRRGRRENLASERRLIRLEGVSRDIACCTRTLAAPGTPGADATARGPIGSQPSRLNPSLSRPARERRRRFDRNWSRLRTGNRATSRSCVETATPAEGGSAMRSPSLSPPRIPPVVGRSIRSRCHSFHFTEAVRTNGALTRIRTSGQVFNVYLPSRFLAAREIGERSMPEYSVNPAGERFPLPERGEYSNESERLTKLAREARREGKEIVVVMGVGFVGAVMAAIVADSVRQEDREARQVRDRLPAPEHAQLLEDPDAQPRRVAGEGRGPRGRSDDPPLRPREEDAHRHLQQRLPRRSPTAWWSTCSATTPSTISATCARARSRWAHSRRRCGRSARRFRRSA